MTSNPVVLVPLCVVEIHGKILSWVRLEHATSGTHESDALYHK